MFLSPSMPPPLTDDSHEATDGAFRSFDSVPSLPSSFPSVPFLRCLLLGFAVSFLPLPSVPSLPSSFPSVPFLRCLLLGLGLARVQ